MSLAALFVAAASLSILRTSGPETNFGFCLVFPQIAGSYRGSYFSIKTVQTSHHGCQEICCRIAKSRRYQTRQAMIWQQHAWIWGTYLRTRTHALAAVTNSWKPVWNNTIICFKGKAKHADLVHRLHSLYGGSKMVRQTKLAEIKDDALDLHMATPAMQYR